MKTKPPAQSVIFNSGFLIGLSVFLLAVFLLALSEFATAQLSPASQAAKAAQPKSGFGEIHSSGKDSSRPLGGQCVTLRGPILTLSTSSDIAFVDTAPAAFNSQDDEFLISWDQFVNTTWTIYDQRLSVDGTLLGENNPVIEGDRKSTRLNSSHGYISYAV